MLTCLVAPKSVAMPQRHADPVPYMMMGSSVTTMPLQCPTRGCAALIDMPINSTHAKLGKCFLTVTVKQTDYDNADGTPETIEYIKVDECDSHGNLFDAVVEVRCTPTAVSAKTALLSRKKKVPLLGRKLKGGVRRSEAADASLL